MLIWLLSEVIWRCLEGRRCSGNVGNREDSGIVGMKSRIWEKVILEHVLMIGKVVLGGEGGLDHVVSLGIKDHF